MTTDKKKILVHEKETIESDGKFCHYYHRSNFVLVMQAGTLILVATVALLCTFTFLATQKWTIITAAKDEEFSGQQVVQNEDHAFSTSTTDSSTPSEIIVDAKNDASSFISEASPEPALEGHRPSVNETPTRTRNTVDGWSPRQRRRSAEPDRTNVKLLLAGFELPERDEHDDIEPSQSPPARFKPMSVGSYRIRDRFTRHRERRSSNIQPFTNDMGGGGGGGYDGLPVGRREPSQNPGTGIPTSSVGSYRIRDRYTRHRQRRSSNSQRLPLGLDLGGGDSETDDDGVLTRGGGFRMRGHFGRRRA